jgi:hypothetical protein
MLVMLFACGACATGAEYSGPIPTPDGQLFVREVYPLLLRDCAFVGCHGAPDRFFQVFGPGRARLDERATKPDAPASLQEVVHGYDRARSMLATADQLDHCLLLQKPLEAAAGGQGHEGVDLLGRNVFASKSAAGYQLLQRWARSNGEQPTAADVAALNASVAAHSEAAP